MYIIDTCPSGEIEQTQPFTEIEISSFQVLKIFRFSPVFFLFDSFISAVRQSQVLLLADASKILLHVLSVV